eukprot:NODE_1979_length_683_cov_12.151079_g1929_i0.p1 GENE.NODE_1979_length_683_cov_12.151079_g1929_i0~~NODE_1979_length_683_cov_12.151079_g1929_i0.p1  ORF type:complete len:150 (+),score=32.67 NODE_1979_length_683_cov_12.151079_g1929_i0:70-519(+)
MTLVLREPEPTYVYTTAPQVYAQQPLVQQAVQQPVYVQQGSPSYATAAVAPQQMMLVPANNPPSPTAGALVVPQPQQLQMLQGTAPPTYADQWHEAPPQVPLKAANFPPPPPAPPLRPSNMRAARDEAYDRGGGMYQMFGKKKRRMRPL